MMTARFLEHHETIITILQRLRIAGQEIEVNGIFSKISVNNFLDAYIPQPSQLSPARISPASSASTVHHFFLYANYQVVNEFLVNDFQCCEGY